MNGTMPVEETRVEDLAHLDFKVRCSVENAEAHAADLYVVCRRCNAHSPICRAHLAQVRVAFSSAELMAAAFGVDVDIIKCTACHSTGPGFDDLFFTVPVTS